MSASQTSKFLTAAIAASCPLLIGQSLPHVHTATAVSLGRMNALNNDGSNNANSGIFDQESTQLRQPLLDEHNNQENQQEIIMQNNNQVVINAENANNADNDDNDSNYDENPNPEVPRQAAPPLFQQWIRNENFGINFLHIGDESDDESKSSEGTYCIANQRLNNRHYPLRTAVLQMRQNGIQRGLQQEQELTQHLLDQVGGFSDDDLHPDDRKCCDVVLAALKRIGFWTPVMKLLSLWLMVEVFWEQRFRIRCLTSLITVFLGTFYWGGILFGGLDSVWGLPPSSKKYACVRVHKNSRLHADEDGPKFPPWPGSRLEPEVVKFHYFWAYPTLCNVVEGMEDIVNEKLKTDASYQRYFAGNPMLFESFMMNMFVIEDRSRRHELGVLVKDGHGGIVGLWTRGDGTQQSFGPFGYQNNPGLYDSRDVPPAQTVDLDLNNYKSVTGTVTQVSELRDEFEWTIRDVNTNGSETGEKKLKNEEGGPDGEYQEGPLDEKGHPQLGSNRVYLGVNKYIADPGNNGNVSHSIHSPVSTNMNPTNNPTTSHEYDEHPPIRSWSRRVIREPPYDDARPISGEAVDNVDESDHPSEHSDDANDGSTSQTGTKTFKAHLHRDGMESLKKDLREAGAPGFPAEQDSFIAKKWHGQDFNDSWGVYFGLKHDEKWGGKGTGYYKNRDPYGLKDLKTQCEKSFSHLKEQKKAWESLADLMSKLSLGYEEVEFGNAAK